MEVIFNFFYEINDFLNQFIKISNNQISWLGFFSLFVNIGIVLFYQIYFQKKAGSNSQKHNTNRVELLQALQAFWISIIGIVVANNAFTSKVFTIEVFISLVSTAFIQIVIFSLTIIDKKNSEKGIYYRLSIFLYLIPILLLVVYFPLFTKNKFLLVLFVIIYLIKIIFEIYEYKLHRSSKWAYLDFKTRLTNYDQQRNEKLRNNITKYKKNSDDLIGICLYSLWICIPGFWLASFYGFLTVLSMVFSYQGAININSINNRITFMTESKPAFNVQILFTVIGISIVFGINFQFMFSFFLAWELTKIFSNYGNKLPENLGILNVQNRGENLFENIGKTLIKRINMKQKNKNSYAVLNNFCPLYETNDMVMEYSKIRNETARNFILVINNDGSDMIHRIEDDFRYSLNNLMVIIDAYEIPERTEKANVFFEDYSVLIDRNEYQFAKWRIDFYSKLCDEKFTYMDREELFSTIHEQISTEAILINIKIRSLLSSQEHDILKSLETKGIFEFHNLFRQAHETSSIPLRFIINLMIWEAASQFLCGFIFAEPIDEVKSSPIYEREGWDKELSFGDYVSYLDKMLKSSDNGIIINRIRKSFESKYLDEHGIELFSKLIHSYGWKDKIPSKPTLQQLFSFMSFVRNKTRGHGVPSKINFDFYLAMEKLSLFLLREMQKLDFDLFVTLDKQDSWDKLFDRNWLVKLSSGGCPDIFPADILEDDSDFIFPYYEVKNFISEQEKLKPILESVKSSKSTILLTLIENDKLHLYSLDNFFKSNSGILLAYNGKKKDAKSFISYTTGELIKPTTVSIE
jgi:hypothetical protein